MIQVKNFNTNNLLISTPLKNEYGGVSAFQGIRSLGSNLYLICGTTNPNPNTGYGLIYIGDINCTNGNIYYLNVPDSLGTSVYGPDYDSNTGIYTFVGSYLDYSQNIKGFIYKGTLDQTSLTNPNNFYYPSVNSSYSTTFLHSTSNGLAVGNSGSDVDNPQNQTTLSYIYDITNLSNYKTVVKFPNSKTTTTYGIQYNGDSSYTLVGGYSDNKISINQIYLPNQIIQPIGNAFIVDYNSKTNTFSNWTSIVFEDSKFTFETHFQGISQNSNGTYSIVADVLNLKKSILPQGYFLTIGRDNANNFVYNYDNWIEIKYDNAGTTSANSVSDNKVVGLFIGSSNITYQSEIIIQSEISNLNIIYDTVGQNEKLLFNNSFLDSKTISYTNGVFTFLEYGNYFVNFNIYIENTSLPAVIFEVIYTTSGKINSFNVVQKGISDEKEITTAHSLVIPCSFISNFNIGDKLEIVNRSKGTIELISNYMKNSTNAIISINKLN